MTVYLRARSVSLELPLDIQRMDQGDRPAGFKATLGGSERLYEKVLKDITFSAEEGDRIGVLGLNGAGKTTLLRVLNGAFFPTTGRIERMGVTQSLLNATLGFSEYASVSENVILRGTAMGLRRRQLDAAMPDILEFAGLASRITHRLHTLSAGQRMRLGFAISTAIQPDILLMDEWIGTGDESFIHRAQERMQSRFYGSRIVVLASHSTALLRSMCNKALVLDRGRMRFFGDIDAGLESYKDVVASANSQTRQNIAVNDPMLFGQNVGLIERIRITLDRIELEGWAVDENGNEAGVICIETPNGCERMTPERVDRQDVRLHLAKRSGHFGFRAALPRPTEFAAADLLAELKISVGTSQDRLCPPLPLAKAAVIEIVE